VILWRQSINAQNKKAARPWARSFFLPWTHDPQAHKKTARIGGQFRV